MVLIERESGDDEWEGEKCSDGKVSGWPVPGA